MEFKFMQKVKASFVMYKDNLAINGGEWCPDTECLFIAYYKMSSLHKRALLYCPTKKYKFFATLKNVKP